MAVKLKHNALSLYVAAIRDLDLLFKKMRTKMSTFLMNKQLVYSQANDKLKFCCEV